MHDEEAGRGQDDRHAETERDNQQQPEREPMKCQSTQQDDQRGCAGDDATGQSEREEVAPGDRQRIFVPVRVVATMLVGVVVAVLIMLRMTLESDRWITGRLAPGPRDSLPSVSLRGRER